MANTLTAVAPTLYSAAQEVSGEPFGVVSAINMSFDDKGVAFGDTVKVPYAPTASNSDFTPAATTSSGTDKIASTVDVTITKLRKNSWHLTSEQLRSLQNGDGNAVEWARQLVAQGMRALRNEAEADACTAIKVGASRAVGTAGTTPFASTLDALADVRKVLRDNGAPMTDLQFVMDTTAALNLHKLGIYQQAYQAGSDAERRSGRFLPQFGFAIGESAGIAVHTAGTGASYLLNGALAVGGTTVTVDTGTGTILAGDITTFAGTSHKYVVNTALSGGVYTIGRPGSRAVEADNDAVTVGASYTPNMAFERNAVVGIMRPPLMPANPTITPMLISDARGMTYLLLEIAQYGQISWELHLGWGFKVVQGEHVALVLG